MPMLVHSNGVTQSGVCCASGCGLAYNCRVPFNVHLHPGIHGRTLGVGPRHSHSSSHSTLRRTTSKSLGYGFSGKVSSESYSESFRTVSKHLGYDFSRNLFSDMGYRTVSYDSGLGGSRAASSDSVCDGSATAATSTRFLSHLVESYQKMSMHPYAEGKLRYA